MGGFLTDLFASPKSALTKALRSGKWFYDESARYSLLQQVEGFTEPLIDDFELSIGDFKPFLELAALGAIGADWLIAKYNNETLHNQLIAMIRSPKFFDSDSSKKIAAAGILLIELARLRNTRDYVPNILEAAKGLPCTEETNFIKWFFARLWVLIDDQRVVDFLVKTLAEPFQVFTQFHDPSSLLAIYDKADPSDGILAMIGEEIPCNPPERPSAVPGPGYHAAELLFLLGEEQGIAALAKTDQVAAILPAKDLFMGYTKPRKLFESANTNRGQIAFLTRYLVQELERTDFNKLHRLPDLVKIADQETINTQVIPLIFDKLQNQPNGFLGENTGIAEGYIRQFELFWTAAPFLRALDHADPRIRLLAVKGLEKTADSNTVTAITRLFEDPDSKVQKAARKAWKRLQ